MLLAGGDLSSRLINHPDDSTVFETNFKRPVPQGRPTQGVFSMLKLYATDAVRDRITLTYRDYDLELTRAPSGWLVGVHPRRPDLPILSRSDFCAGDKESAVTQAKKRIDWTLLSYCW